MIPYARHDGTPMTPEQCAEWLGCDVSTMQGEHDPLHRDLCRWLGVPSLSLQVGAGRKLDAGDQLLAELEEHAVLAVQRFQAHWRKVEML